MTPWILITIAGLLEVVWASGLKETKGFTKLVPSLWVLAAMVASFFLLARAMQSLPAGVAYSVWVGIGAVGTVIVGIVLLGEKLSILQLICLAAITLGIVGLKLAHPAAPTTALAP